jgi:2-dehydro-3-deoxygalactonokinase
MHLAVIDCGTTNSRIYIVNDNAEVVAKASRKLGIRDAVMSGGNEVLKDGLKEILYQTLEQADLELGDIGFAISSGMITSEIGLMEVPHLCAPVHIDDLARNIEKIHDLSVFPVDITLYLIPGIKNSYDPRATDISVVGDLDFMRGEETQIAGLLSVYDIELPVTVVILSSHTKFVSIDEGGSILGSLTTLSGQLYEAIIRETSIGKSLVCDDDSDDEHYFDSKVINIAYELVERSGFTRVMLMPRFLDVLLETKWYERKLFVEAAIASEDIKVIDDFSALEFPLDTNFILCGSEGRCAIYNYLLREKAEISRDILAITSTEDIDILSVKGAIYIAKTAGLI